MAEPLVVIEGLNKSYGGLKVLRDISLTVGEGEVVSLIGPSGCGKTTLLRCVNFLESHDSGSIRIGGSRSATWWRRTAHEDRGASARSQRCGPGSGWCSRVTTCSRI